MASTKRPRAEFEAQAAEPGLLQRSWTVSIALPGSIVYNAQSRELQTHLAGQIARIACIFQVDEIVVFDDGHSARGKFDANRFLAKLLQYAETPQYLRKHLFPRDPDLKLAGLLPPLDAPHHLRADEWFSCREGVVLDRPGGKEGGSIVDIGLAKSCALKQTLVPGTRVTVQMSTSQPAGMRQAHLNGLSTAAQESAAKRIQDVAVTRKHNFKGSAVSSRVPVETAGVYWGYNVRLAEGLSAVLTECPWPNGYDLIIGTSERGEHRVDSGAFSLPGFSHLMVVFGGVAGLEDASAADAALAAAGISDVSDMFDMYVNTCPFQGSRTIRTEEALSISLASLQPAIKVAQAK